jgi:hypothetical protein
MLKPEDSFGGAGAGAGIGSGAGAGAGAGSGAGSAAAQATVPSSRKTINNPTINLFITTSRRLERSIYYNAGSQKRLRNSGIFSKISLKSR